MFSSYKDGGFAIKFDNDVVVSIQFSDFHYCDNPKRQLSNKIFCKNAELGIYIESKPRIWLTKKFAASVLSTTITDNVLGFITHEIAVKAMSWAQRY